MTHTRLHVDYSELNHPLRLEDGAVWLLWSAQIKYG